MYTETRSASTDVTTKYDWPSRIASITAPTGEFQGEPSSCVPPTPLISSIPPARCVLMQVICSPLASRQLRLSSRTVTVPA
jgi:hypothetical protein